MSLGRVGTRSVLAGLACCVLGLLGAGSALAEVTKTFTYTGNEQKFKARPGVTSLNVVAVGSEGGRQPTGAAPGVSAIVRGTLAVNPEQVLYVEVAGLPFNGGGSTSPQGRGGPGGGASDIRTVPVGEATSPGNEVSLLSRLLVAAGGGGGGANNFAPGSCPGGAGGDPEEKGADGTSCGYPPGEGGGAGEAGKGGAGGTSYLGSSSFDEAPGEPGRLGAGGAGVEGGGGGGGLYGGGGGGAQFGAITGPAGEQLSGGGNGGGGGGSNLVPEGGSAEKAPRGEPASVTIGYTLPPTCSSAVGKGTFLKTGALGRISLINEVSTNLTAHQRLHIGYTTESGKVGMNLEKLESATCTVAGDERIFEGAGSANKELKRGYKLKFAIREVEGGVFFMGELSKEGTKELEPRGGPLMHSTEKIT